MFSYDCQASCFAWDKENRLLFVGLQTGTIKQYRIHESYKKVDVLPDISVHTSRVTGLLYDAKKGRLVLEIRFDLFLIFVWCRLPALETRLERCMMFPDVLLFQSTSLMRLQ